MSEQFPYSFGKYRMEAEIGRGGFGTVFRAVDVDLDRQVAIKVMDPIYLRDQRWVARFRREARVMANLDHPHIVPIYEIGEEDGRLFLAMKLIDAPDLAQLIAEQGPLPWDIVVKMVAQIASALDYAHQQKVIHRDLKPGNILVSSDNAMLTDFGLAQMVESNSQSISVSGGFAGTYNYMAPEVFNNQNVSPASDVYALGCVIYEMLVGKMLVEGQTTAAIIGAHLKGVRIEEPMPEGTPRGTRELLENALAKDPLDRYASAADLAQELARLSTDQLAKPYAALEQALVDRRWQEALEIAAVIRAQDPQYRDSAALEERALVEDEAEQRLQWATQWRTGAEQALANDNFDEARGALIQWRRVAPDDPRIAAVEKELELAEKYVSLERLIADQEWEDAQAAAQSIYTQDPSFRDITALLGIVNKNIVPEAPVEPKSADKPAPTKANSVDQTVQDKPKNAGQGAAITQNRSPESATLSDSSARESIPSVSDYLNDKWRRVKSGDLGYGPTIIALIVIVFIFTAQTGVFLSSRNVVNLLVNTVYITLVAIGVMYVMVLGEIDLSIGEVGTLAAVIMAFLLEPYGSWPWIVALIAALAAAALIGLAQGSIIVKFRLPSFIVTVAGALMWGGVALYFASGGIPIESDFVFEITNYYLPTGMGWIMSLALIILYTVVQIRDWRSGQQHKDSKKPLSIVIAQIITVALVIAAATLIINEDHGVPLIFIFMIVLLVGFTFLAERTRFGHHMYAIGANLEQARSAGINVKRIKILVFLISSVMASLGGIVLASRIRYIYASFGLGSLTFSAITAALLGGASLYGGRGRVFGAFLGAMVIASVDIGLSLLGWPSESRSFVSGLILLLAVLVDGITRQRRVKSGIS